MVVLTNAEALRDAFGLRGMEAFEMMRKALESQYGTLKLSFNERTVRIIILDSKDLDIQPIVQIFASLTCPSYIPQIDGRDPEGNHQILLAPKTFVELALDRKSLTPEQKERALALARFLDNHMLPSDDEDDNDLSL